MRALKPEEWALGAAVLLALAYAGWEWAGYSRANADLRQPPRQPSPDDLDARERLGIMRAGDGHSVICHPEEHWGVMLHTRHRYPVGTGGEVTSAIHNGWSSMRIPSADNAQSVQWMISPPSEAAW